MKQRKRRQKPQAPKMVVNARRFNRQWRVECDPEILNTMVKKNSATRGRIAAMDRVHALTGVSWERVKEAVWTLN